MAVDYIELTGGDIKDLPIDNDKCIDVVQLMLDNLNGRTINTRELIIILGALLQTVGASIEENENCDRSHVWKKYKEKGSLGYALQLSGLDMIEHWAEAGIEPADPEES